MANKEPSKLPLGALLNAIDTHQGDWLSRQPLEARGEFNPTVIIRMLSDLPHTDAGATALCLLNERVNLRLYSLTKHPDLVFRLMASCGIGRRQRHRYLKPPKKRGLANKAHKFMLTWYPEANDAEIAILLTSLDLAGFEQMLDESGMQADGERKKILDDFKKLPARL
jgi:hypothetical protein